MNRVLTTGLFLFLFGLLLGSCSQSPDIKNSSAAIEVLPPLKDLHLPQGQKLKIVATTTILGDVIYQIAGDLAELTVLLPPGQDPHSYSPSPRDLVLADQADLVFVNGFNLEEGLLKTLRSVIRKSVIPASVGIIPLVHSHETEGESEDHPQEADPHVYFSVRNVQIWVKNIVSALSTVDPDHKFVYEKRGQTYITTLQNLDTEIQTAVETIPITQRNLITGHDIYGYFARDYGFSVLGTILPGVTTQVEPSPRQLTHLVNLIKKTGAKAVFVGSSEAPGILSLALALKKEMGPDFRILPTLADSLTPPGGLGSAYLEFMRYNVNQIVEGLK